MILKLRNSEYECSRVVKGVDWIQCYAENQPTTRFEGITDFSKFTLEGGEFEEAPEPVDVDQLKEQIAFLQKQIDILTGGCEMMDALERARQTRKAIELYAETAPDDQAAQTPSLYEEWTPDGVYYPLDKRVREDGVLYKCITTHSSQADWKPSDSPSLWVRIDDPSIEWPEWRQPAGSTDAYRKGSKVSHTGKRWISEVDNNVWEPGEYGWAEADA